MSSITTQASLKSWRKTTGQDYAKQFKVMRDRAVEINDDDRFDRNPAENHVFFSSNTEFPGAKVQRLHRKDKLDIEYTVTSEEKVEREDGKNLFAGKQRTLDYYTINGRGLVAVKDTVKTTLAEREELQYGGTTDNYLFADTQEREVAINLRDGRVVAEGIEEIRLLRTLNSISKFEEFRETPSKYWGLVERSDSVAAHKDLIAVLEQ